MISTELLKAYRRERARHPKRGIRGALMVARRALAEKDAGLLDWHEVRGEEVAAWRDGAFLVVAHRGYDMETWDDEGAGKFTNTWEPGAVRHSEGGREYRWWVPGQDPEEVAGYYHDLLGYAWQPAREKAARQLQEAYHYACNPEPSCYISVTVYHSAQDPEEDLFRYANWIGAMGPQLATYTVGGFYGPDDLDARDVAADALAEARKAVAGLQGIAV